MSDIGLIMNLLLGVLLVGALFLGWRLEGRLKALRASHQSFSKAVEDLDRAAARAEQGLADLLAARIERAGHLAGRLEKLTADAEGVHTRLATAPRLDARLEAPRPAATRAAVQRPEPSRGAEVLRAEALRATAARPDESRESAFARFAERYGSAKSGHSPSVLAEAAARNDLILEDDAPPSAPSVPTPNGAFARLSPAAAARMERLQALARPRPAASKPDVRNDDELFEMPRRAIGGLR